MGRFNLGDATTKVNSKINDGDLYLDYSNAKFLFNDILLQYDYIYSSLTSLNILLNKAVNLNYVNGNSIDIFKGWSKKCSSQANSTIQRKESLIEKFTNDEKLFSLNVLDSQIESIEKQISSLEN